MFKRWQGTRATSTRELGLYRPVTQVVLNVYMLNLQPLWLTMRPSIYTCSMQVRPLRVVEAGARVGNDEHSGVYGALIMPGVLSCCV